LNKQLNKGKEDRIGSTTNGTYPSSLLTQIFRNVNQAILTIQKYSNW